MGNGEIITINGAWSEEDNAWVSEVLCLTGNIYLEVSLPSKGRLVVKKSESAEGPWPKAMVSSWSGPKFRIRMYGSTKDRYVRIYLTEEPTMIQYVNTQGSAVEQE